jgi:hypothetical protein
VRCKQHQDRPQWWNTPLRSHPSFATHGVPPLEFKAVYPVGDLFLQRLDALEQEAEGKGSM